MRILLVILMFAFGGCVVQKPLSAEGTLIKSERIEHENETVQLRWTILTNGGDTIVRYLIRVDPNMKPGERVPYFNYK